MKNILLIIISILMTACYGQTLDLIDTVDSITPTTVSYNITWDDNINKIVSILNNKGVYSYTIIDFSSTSTSIFLVAYNSTEAKIKSYTTISGNVADIKKYNLSFGIDDEDKYKPLFVYDTNGNKTADLVGDEILLLSNKAFDDFTIGIDGDNLKTMSSSRTSIELVIYNCKIDGSSIIDN